MPGLRLGKRVDVATLPRTKGRACGSDLDLVVTVARRETVPDLSVGIKDEGRVGKTGIQDFLRCG